MRIRPIVLAALAVLALPPTPSRALGLTATLPDGRIVSPAGFTTPVESFASGAALSPDGRYLAVLSQDAGAIDVLDLGEKTNLVERLPAPEATALTWNADGLFVARGYSGIVARFGYASGGKHAGPSLEKRPDLRVDAGGLINGIAEDPRTHRIAVARTAAREVVTLDERSGTILVRRPTRGQPFAVAFAGDVLVATQYNATSVVAWRGDSTAPREIATGPHPTQLDVDGDRIFVADADGHDVALIDAATLSLRRRYELAVGPDAPPGQTPAGMALSADGATLYVAESGFNDVAVVDLASGRIRTRIPTAWYPTAVVALTAATSEKDARKKQQLFIVSAKGLGSQPDPGGEWNGTYTGLVQHVLVDPTLFDTWTAAVARNDRLAPEPSAPTGLPPIKHVVFIVHENKHFDEVFGDDPRADADPSLLVFGRPFTPNAHALADRYALFDNFMSNGEASIFGHASTTQGMVNDYHERNAHSQDDDMPEGTASVAYSIWPYPIAGEDTMTPAAMDFDWFRDLGDLPGPPRINVSGVFGPRGELVDELQRKGISFRVYGEQLTMEPDGRIAPGLAAHAVRTYPGDHIDYGVSDTERAKIFLDDVSAHGLPAYAYLTLPTDHTAGKHPGFYTPAAFVASNDLAYAQIVAGLSKRPDWRDTVVFSTCDDAQGTGDHVDSHRMPALAVGPYVRRSFVDHTRYSIPSILRTVEVLYGLAPLNIFDAAATPMYAAFAQEPLVEPFTPLAETVPMTRNPGTATSFVQQLDGPDSAQIANEEWDAMRGPRAIAALPDDR